MLKTTHIKKRSRSIKCWKPRQKLRSSNRRIPKKTLIVGAVIFFVIFLTAFPVIRVGSNAVALKYELFVLKQALAANDFDKLQKQLPVIKKRVEKTRKSVYGLAWVRLIPFVGGYHGDFNHAMLAVEHGVGAGEYVLEALAPFAEALGFETDQPQDSSVETGDKLAAMFRSMPALAPAMGDISAQLKLVGEQINLINPNRYPQKFNDIPIRDVLIQLQESLLAIDESASDLEELLILLPRAFGDPTAKTYALIFQNDGELRPTGGFWTAYSTLTFDKGEFGDPVSVDMYALDDRIVEPVLPVPAPYRRLLLVEEWYARDANIYPDFKDSVEKFKWFLEKDPEYTAPVDGFIAIDTALVEGLVGVLGGVSVPGYSETFTVDNVIDQMEYYSNEVLSQQSGRKDLIGYLMQTVIKDLLDASQVEWLRFALAAGELINEKHILLYFEDAELQALAEKYNAGGRMQYVDGDYLHINHANLGGAKSNRVIQQSVAKLTTSKHGKLVSKLILNYHNPEEDDGLLNRPCPMWVRIYVPLGSKLLSFSSSNYGQAVESEEYGKTMFETYIAVDPLGSTHVELEYELPSSISVEDYSLYIQKQPGTRTIPYLLELNEKRKVLGVRKDEEIMWLTTPQKESF